MPPAALLCALHPLPAVRRQVLARCPAGLTVREAADTADLVGLPRVATLVVLFDPARTAPADVRRACVGRAVLVSISDLRLSAAEIGVDVALPLRRLSEADIARVVFDAIQRRTLAVAR